MFGSISWGSIYWGEDIYFTTTSTSSSTSSTSTSTSSTSTSTSSTSTSTSTLLDVGFYPRSRVGSVNPKIGYGKINQSAASNSVSPGSSSRYFLGKPNIKSIKPSSR